MRLIKFMKRLPTMVVNIWKDLEPNDTIVSMAPRNDIVNGNSYYKSLSAAISNDEIRNIGLIGKNGVGKSSVISHYLTNSARRKYKLISLADFKIKGANTCPSPDEIERSVLQQLFYKTDFKRIPGSRFRRINHFPKWKAVIHTTLIVFFAFVVLEAFKIEFIENLDLIKQAMISIVNSTRIGTTIWNISCVLLFVAFYRMYYGVRNNFLLSRIGNKNFEIKKKDSTEKSNILNENFDEIMYYFSSTKTNLVVFEDLDRLNDLSVLIKLREICDLVNNSEVIKFNVTFLYALSDTLFNSSTDDKTKFFDYIITVLPTVTASNSGIELNKLLKSRGIDINERVLSEVMIYVNDMRSIKNIFNDFIHFKDSLKDNLLDDTKLLCFIVYKNLHPQDYADVQERKGFLFEIIDNKMHYVQGLVHEIEVKIEDHRTELMELKADHISTVNELRKIYLFDAITQSDIEGNKVNIQGQYQNIGKLLNDEFFTKIGDTLHVGHSRTGFRNVNFKQILEGTKPTYFERVEKLNKSKISKVERAIETLEARLVELRNIKVQRLLSEADEFDYKVKSNVPSEIMFMLKRGYIGEDYNDYITVIDSEDRSYDDISFIRTHQANEEVDYYTSLKSLEKVFDSFEFDDFKKEKVYNISFLDYILEENKHDELKEVISNIIKNTRGWSFLRALIHKTTKRKELLQEIVENWSTFWDDVHESKNLTSEEKLEFFVSLFSGDLTIKQLETLNKNNGIQYFTEEIVYIEEVYDSVENKELFKEFVVMAGVKVISLYESERDNELVSYLIENTCYELTFQNMNFIDEELIITRPLEYVFDKKKDSDLNEKYMENNYAILIDNLMLNNEKSNEERETYKKILALDLDSDLIERVVLHFQDSFEFLDYGEDVNRMIFKNRKNDNDCAWIENHYSNEDEPDESLVSEFVNRFSSFENVDALTSLTYKSIVSIPKRMRNLHLIKHSESSNWLQDLQIDEIHSENLIDLIKDRMFEATDQFITLCLSLAEDVIENMINSYFSEFFKFIETNEIDLNIHKLIYRSGVLSSSNKLRVLLYEYDNSQIDIEEMKEIFRQQYSENFAVLILGCTSRDLKVIFVSEYFKVIKNFKIDDFLFNLGYEYRRLLEEGKRPSFEKNTINHLLLDTLSSNGVVGKVYEDNSMLRVHIKKKDKGLLGWFSR